MQIYFKSNHSLSFSKILSNVSKRNGGFTLLEFLMVITIATIITTALVIQHNRWNDHLAVKTQAYELALMIRQAQIWSLGVREHVPTHRFDVGYGVNIDEDIPNRYIFFADLDGDKKYDNGEEMEIKFFNRGVSINKFCGLDVSGLERCNQGTGWSFLYGLAINQAVVSFLRPQTDSNPIFLTSSNHALSGPPLEMRPPLKIYIRSPQGNESVVTIEANGQISTQ